MVITTMYVFAVLPRTAVNINSIL